MILREGERRQLAHARAGRHLRPEESVALIERLGRTRAGHLESSEPQWREAYEQACDAIAILLRHLKGDREGMLKEMERLQIERDDAREDAKAAHARYFRVLRERGEDG